MFFHVCIEVKTDFFTQELSNSCPIIKVKLSYKPNNIQQWHAVMTGNDGLTDGLISQNFQLEMFRVPYQPMRLLDW